MIRVGLAGTALLVLLAGCTAAPAPAPSASPTVEASPSAAPSGLVLDPTHDYGDRYADGILPVGDGKYSGDTAAVGTVLLCNPRFDANAPGAQSAGPWFLNDNTQWDISKKISVAGAVNWDASMTVTLSGGTRVIETNDLPDHHTGVFPIAGDDPASQYDRNPNAIAEQSLRYELTASPTPGDPQCMGGEAGVMLTGVALFNAFDAGGRDAGAWEVQDDCEGHPQISGEYHYHTLSNCITQASVTDVIGFALDGFPITGPKIAEGNILTTADLDECHGITSDLELDGKLVTTYHYVMTQDFPYSVSCFRADPIDPPGVHEH